MITLLVTPMRHSRVLAVAWSVARFCGGCLLAAADRPATPAPKPAMDPVPWTPETVHALLRKVNNWQTAHPKQPANDRNWIRGASPAYVDAALGLHRQNFTPHGMFLEHGQPTAYDHFSRTFLGGMLQDDFRSPACTLEILESEPHRAMFIATYDLFDPDPAKRIQLFQTFVVTPGAVAVTDEVYPAMKQMRITWPMLVFDGQEHSNVEIAGNTATVTLGGRGVRFTVEAPANVALKRTGQVLNHRNGQVEPVIAEFSGRRAAYRITPHAPNSSRAAP